MGRLALLAVVALALAACGSGGQEAQPPEPTSDARGFSGTTLDGETISLRDFRGRPLLLNVWSSW